MSKKSSISRNNIPWQRLLVVGVLEAVLVDISLCIETVSKPITIEFEQIFCLGGFEWGDVVLYVSNEMLFSQCCEADGAECEGDPKEVCAARAEVAVDCGSKSSNPSCLCSIPEQLISFLAQTVKKLILVIN
jgi:hypothetical protein